MRFKFIILLLFSYGMLSCRGTGSTYQPIVENKTEAYYRDLHYCQQLSQERHHLDGDMGNSALVGAGTGGLIGGFLGDGIQGIGAGAAIGAGISMGGQTLRANQDKKYIIVECLRRRGHRVIM
ncbi:MAG: hypothetical protein O3A66_01495 [Proteobacteria bacterium]|jgi:hypothetical protein|nr:hypothetical protein [Pseudomonadota bacterium]